MSYISESELLEQIQAGHEDALLALHTRYAHLVYSVAYRVLNDSMAAEEVTQDTFMRLWHKSDAYDASKGSFITWLLTITRRLAIDTFRKLRRDPMLDPVFIDAAPELWDNVLRAEEGGDLRQTLIDSVRQLPNEQWQAIELAYFYGMSHQQIADYLHVPLGTVKTRIRLGMEKLREALGPILNPKRGGQT
ncbi:MAG TPA: sigma-70 family RNA polymerase sigma factor [Aggregatilineaceae bacterium]|jgi:RNA polymerase sigma-70 factor (ECF subfamily)|nr:sigma-70 family RNA polymerase sigma factor [Aggregatilineaceae bacterium]